METFILTMFWLMLFLTLLRTFNLATGTYKKQQSMGYYAADTVLVAAIAIWAGFALWYR